jgi:hypothetical protein
MAKKPDDQYDPEESKQRMIAALRGARLAGHVPMGKAQAEEGGEENKEAEVYVKADPCSLFLHQRLDDRCDCQ